MSIAYDRFKLLGQFRDSRRVEQNTERDVLVESFLQPRDNLSREQRVSTEFEKVVENCNVLDLQNFSPYLSDQFLNLASRRNKFSRKRRSCAIRRWKAVPVHLPVWHQR